MYQIELTSSEKRILEEALFVHLLYLRKYIEMNSDDSWISLGFADELKAYDDLYSNIIKCRLF